MPKPKPKPTKATHARPKPKQKVRPPMPRRIRDNEDPSEVEKGENAQDSYLAKTNPANQYQPVTPTEYPKGEIEKGRIDYEALAECDTANDIPMRDRRAYLINQAELNEAANDELNALQVAGHRRLHEATAFMQDPDWQRENSMQTAIASLEMHDPEKVLANRDERREQRRVRRIELRAQQRPTMLVPNPDNPTESPQGTRARAGAASTGAGTGTRDAT